MSDDCRRLADAAPELVLGILPGDERAWAIGHLDSCAPCREVVTALAGCVDDVLVSTPLATPETGFEARVLAAIGAGEAGRHGARPRRKRRRRVVLVSTALALAAAVAVLAWPSTTPRALSAEMRTPAGAVVGTAELHDGADPWVSVSVPGWADQLHEYGSIGAYSVVIGMTDGSQQSVPVNVAAGWTWRIALPGPPSTVAAVAVVDAAGTVRCRATFTPRGDAAAARRSPG